MPPIPGNKLELYQAIRSAHDSLLADYRTIPAEYVRKAGVEGNSRGTTISVSDTIAYLIGWEKLVLKWYERRSAGKAVDFPETGYKWNQLGELAAHFHSQHREWSYPALLREFETTTARILQLVESLSDRELYGAAWYEKYTLGRMVQLNTSSPMKNMRGKVRRFKRENGIA